MNPPKTWCASACKTLTVTSVGPYYLRAEKRGPRQYAWQVILDRKTISHGCRRTMLQAQRAAISKAESLGIPLRG